MATGEAMMNGSMNSQVESERNGVEERPQNGTYTTISTSRKRADNRPYHPPNGESTPMEKTL